jgi:two-component system cell cycle sensor histidine kinase/response regulator CckA
MGHRREELVSGRFSPASLRLRLVALVLIAALPGLALLVYTGGKLRQEAAASAQMRALLLAESASHDQSLLIEDARNLLPALARVPEVLAEDSQACSTRFSELLNEYPAFANIGAIRPEGQLFCSALPFTSPVDLSDRSYFQQALSNRAFAIGEYQIGRVTRKASINFGYPAVDSSGDVRAVVFAALDLDWLSSLPAELDLPQDTSIMVFDNSGTILTLAPDPEAWVGQSVPEADVIRATLSSRGKGVLEAPGLDGTPRLFGYQPLEPSPSDGGVFIAVGIPTDVALAEVRQIQLVNYSTLALALVAALAAAWFGGEVVLLRGIRRLRDAARRVADGDLTVSSGLQSDMSELGDLGRAFDHMSSTIGLREDEIRQAADELRRLNCSLTILSAGNQAIIRAEDETELLEEICRITIRIGGFPLVWVGYSEPQIGGMVKRMAFAGSASGYLEAVEVSSSGEDGTREPSGEAIRLGARQLVRDFEGSKGTARYPWMAEARARGITACLALPLLLDGEAFGCFSLYASSANAFDDRETQLLAELADDLAFGIHHLRSEGKRRKAESELQQLGQFHKEIVETVGEVIAAEDERGRFTFLNPAVTALLGYEVHELLGRHWTTIVPEDQRSIIEAAYDRRLSGEADSYEVQLLAKSGERIPVIVAGAPRGQGQAFSGTVAVYTDLRDRKRAEDQIRRHALRQEGLNRIIALAASASNVFEVMDELLGHIAGAVEVDKAAIWLSDRFVGRGISREAGKSIAAKLAGPDIDNSQALVVGDWSRDTNDARALSLVEAIRGNDISASIIAPVFVDTWLLGWICLATERPRQWSTEEIELVEAMGRQVANTAQRQGLLETTQEQAEQLQQILDSVQEGIFTVSEAGNVLMANPAASEYLRLLADVRPGERLMGIAGRPFRDLLTPRPDGLPHEIVNPGSPRRVFELSAHRNPESSAFGVWTVLMREVSSARELQERAQLQDRLAAVGQLAAGIAHDFNNIIGTMILYSEMLLKEPALETRARERAMTIFNQAQRAAELTQQILDFSRRAVVAKHPLDLIDFLMEFRKLVERTLPENISIEMDVPEGEVIISADPGRLQQIVMNLTLNARDSMPGGGKLTFDVDRVQVKPGMKPPESDMHPGEWARMIVSDTGEGIKEEDIPHIFEPFYTTKGPGEGTGLGLSQVYGLIKQHAGFIDVKSKVGEGTAFIIHLPLITVDTLPPTLPQDSARRKGAGQLILVAEDDPTIRDAVREALEDHNYRVLLAADGTQALEVVEQHRGSISLIISDLVMPRMSGRDLYRNVRERYPSIKMILITGYPLGGDTQELLDAGAATWIQKPFVSDVLVEKVEELLAKSD